MIDWLEGGHFGKVISACEDLLTNGASHPQIKLFLAIAHGRNGDIERSEAVFTQLRQQIGNNPEINYNLGLIYQENNLLNQAIEAYRQCLGQAPQHAAAWNNLGMCYQRQGRPGQEMEALQQALRWQPGNPVYHRNLATTLNAQRAFSQATRHWEYLTNHPAAEINDYIGLLEAQIASRQLAAGTRTAQHAQKKWPNEPVVWLWSGRLALEKKQFPRAIRWLEKYHRHEKSDQQAQHDLASAYSLAGQHEEAKKITAEILCNGSEADYAFAAELGMLANHTNETQAIVEKGLAQWPNSGALQLLSAKLLRAQKKYSRALDITNKVLTRLQTNQPDTFLQADAQYEQGHCLDRLSRHKEAWNAFCQANHTLKELWRKTMSHADPFLVDAQDLANSFQSAKPNMENNKAPCPSRLVFVVGFPRSGTTLIDNILAAHPDVSVLEEAQILSEVYEGIENISATNYAERLQQLSCEEKQRLRDLYFDLLPDYVAGEIKPVVVDKSPMNALHAGLIHTLFPEAKIIFAQRHPADVILSCFMQNFQLNSFMTNLLNINQAAHTYNAMLSAWECATTRWRIPYYAVVYEKLVSDFEPLARKLVAQAGLPWHNDVLQYHKKTHKRGTITTPSFNQASKPVYTSSRYRYVNYLPYIQDALSIVRPWIEKMGYETPDTFPCPSGPIKPHP